MRELTGHVVNPVNDKLKIEVLDAPGQGGANHLYRISGAKLGRNPAEPADGSHIDLGDINYAWVLFQNGPINENGVNGITQEVLLEIIEDRLRCFQAGPFASEYNARALRHVIEAKDALLQRTRDRMARGVEGQNKA